MWPVALGLTFHGFLAPAVGLAARSSLFCNLVGARGRQLPVLPGVLADAVGLRPALQVLPLSPFALVFLHLSPLRSSFWQEISGARFLLGYRQRE